MHNGLDAGSLGISFGVAIVIVFVFILIVLAIREVWCWYWKINKIVSRIDNISVQLNESNRLLGQVASELSSIRQSVGSQAGGNQPRG